MCKLTQGIDKNIFGACESNKNLGSLLFMNPPPQKKTAHVIFASGKNLNPIPLKNIFNIRAYNAGLNVVWTNSSFHTLWMTELFGFSLFCLTNINKIY